MYSVFTAAGVLAVLLLFLLRPAWQAPSAPGGRFIIISAVSSSK